MPKNGGTGKMTVVFPVGGEISGCGVIDFSGLKQRAAQVS